MENLSKIIEQFKGTKGALIDILQAVQNREGYLSQTSMRVISERTGVPAAEIYGVATFYSQFRLKPQGRHTIRVCKGTACHVSGADTVAAAVRSHLNLKTENDTTDDGRFTVLEVACLGCCSLAPVMMVDEDTHGKLSVSKVSKILDKYE